MGNDGITAAPASTISIAQTLAKTGRRMKKSANMQGHSSIPIETAEAADQAKDIPKCFSRWQALPFMSNLESFEYALALRNYRRAVHQELCTGNDHFFSGLNPVTHLVVVPNRFADGQGSLLGQKCSASLRLG